MASPRSGSLDVLCVGRACVDEILQVERFPAEDTKVPIEARLREGGGQASTAACLVGHLGGRVSFVGVLGADADGAFARRRMAAFGVDLAWLPPPRGDTPLAFCIASREEGSRTILYQPSAPERLAWDEVAPALDATRPRVVLVDPQAEHLLPALSGYCGEHDSALVVDAEHARAGWQETWGRADVLAMAGGFLAEAFPRLPTPAALAAVAEATRGWCIVTRGKAGLLTRVDGRTVSLAAPEVAVCDTTGAGDAFHGALALALARGWQRMDALRYAVAAASLGCRGLGGRSFAPVPELDALWPQLGFTAPA